jgi:hypothetical protein
MPRLRGITLFFEARYWFFNVIRFKGHLTKCCLGEALQFFESRIFAQACSGMGKKNVHLDILLSRGLAEFDDFIQVSIRGHAYAQYLAHGVSQGFGPI